MVIYYKVQDSAFSGVDPSKEIKICNRIGIQSRNFNC